MGPATGRVSRSSQTAPRPQAGWTSYAPLPELFKQSRMIYMPAWMWAALPLISICLCPSVEIMAAGVMSCRWSSDRQQLKVTLSLFSGNLWVSARLGELLTLQGSRGSKQGVGWLELVSGLTVVYVGSNDVFETIEGPSHALRGSILRHCMPVFGSK